MKWNSMDIEPDLDQIVLLRADRDNLNEEDRYKPCRYYGGGIYISRNLAYLASEADAWAPIE